eukprot:GEMP01029298.1.p1 GENE.GEMP01029298.1~~GEMP01029298.1.p1  ORF type:complete len:301 (-),score=65.75 GEMP01029298.1:1219-2121(-)
MAHMSAHAILGVEEGATPAAVRKAWLRKARTLHPDKQGDTEEFQRLQNAYEQLVGGGTTASNNDSKTNLMRWASTYVSASSSTCSPPELNNVNAQDDTGRTALMYAAAHNAEALRMILANEADIASRNCGGHSALHFAYDLPECLEELIRAKADVNCSTYYGLTTLMLSAAKGNLAAVKVLLQAHAEVDAASDVGFTAICMAADKANVNVRYRLGRTPLMSAAASGHTDVVNLLLEAKADKEAKCERSLRAADYASTAQKDGLLCPQQVQEQAGARAALESVSCWRYCFCLPLEVRPVGR